LAATTLSKVGESDLSWIAAERALRAAEHADNPLVLASAARAGTHALLANGRYDDAMSLGTTAASWLRERMDVDDPAALSLFGMLHLRTAVAAARHQDRSTAQDLLGRAAGAAERLGEDANYWQTQFGPRTSSCTGSPRPLTWATSHTSTTEIPRYRPRASRPSAQRPTTSTPGAP
jgi:hypothetical protein